jgi:hypothetical protein
MRRAALTLLLLVAPSTALAQQRDPAGAEALFREGRRLATLGDYASACPKFGDSERLDDAAGTLFNLADCEEHIGKTASAWEHFARSVERLAPGDPRRDYAREHAALLEPKLARLTVTLAPGTPPAAAVSRDGVLLGTASLGAPLPVDPGEHVIVVSAPAFDGRQSVIEVRPGEHRSIEVSLGGGQRVWIVPAGEGIADPARAQRTTGLVVGGAGIVGLIAGGVLGVHALALKSDSESMCSGGVCRDASGVTSHENAQAFALASDMVLGTGLLALVAGGYLVLSAAHTRATPTVGLSARAVVLGIAW